MCGIGAMGLRDSISYTGAQNEGLQIPAPKVSGRAAAQTWWYREFLSYADLHALVGCLTGQVIVDFSGVRTDGQVISAGFTARNLQDRKISQYALRSCRADNVFQSIYDRHSFSRDLWEALNEQCKQSPPAQRVDLNKHLIAPRLGPGEASLSMLDCTTCIDEEVTRLCTIVYPTFIMSTLVR